MKKLIFQGGSKGDSIGVNKGGIMDVLKSQNVTTYENNQSVEISWKESLLGQTKWS